MLVRWLLRLAAADAPIATVETNMNDLELEAFLNQAVDNAKADAQAALKLNDDTKYWAACGRRSAYAHVLQLIAERAREARR